MRAKLLPLTILMSTAMCGGVFAFAISQAQAETFSAQGSWAISKATGQQQNATPYCALARRFGNGSVLTFARNSFDETSVAIDFPKGTFKTGKEYTITFDAGQGQRRSFEAQPVSERGVVVRMGRDEKFYSALEQSGSLGISVNDKAYTFAMPDVKDGTQELAACLGATVEPAAGSASPSPAAPVKEAVAAPAPKMAEVASRVMKSEPKTESAPAQVVAAMSAPLTAASDAALQNVKEENIRLKNALERERRVYEEKMQQGANTSAAAEMTEKLRLLETENRELKAQVGAKTAASAKPVAVDPQLVALKEENARLKTDSQSQVEKIAALEAAQKAAVSAKTTEADAQMVSLKDQISKLQTENGSLKNTLAQNEASKPNPAELAALKDENARLKMDVQSQQQKIAALDASQKTAVLAKSAEADSQLAGLKDQISKLQAENGTLKNNLAQNLAQNQVAKSDQAVLASLQEENTRLKANVESQQQKISALEATQKTAVAAKASASDAELAGLKDQVTKLQAENTTLKSTVAQNQAAKVETAQLTALKDENARLKTDAQSQQQKVAALEASQKSALTAKSSEADAQLASVKAELSKIQAENAVLKNTVAQGQAQIASSQQNMKESVSAVSKMKAMEMQLASVQSERDRLLKEVTGMKNADADGRVKISSDNWNLEQSTRRFNEAELEIRRLGASMEQERAKCAVEKKDLEYMLFDPKIAEKQQIAKLLSLEEELAQTKLALEKAGGMTMAQAAVSPQPNSFAALKPVAVEKQMLGKKDQVSASDLADITPAAGGNAATGPISRDPVMKETVGNDKVAMGSATTPVSVPMSMKAAATVPAGTVSSAPAVPTAVPVPAMVAAAVPSVPKGKMMAASDVESILRQAGISMSGHVQPAPTTGGANQVAYRWETDELFGTAEQKTIQSSAQFDSFISEYLKKTQSRCTGEFASSPAMYETDGSNRLAAYEIACVDADGAGASAALVFESKDGIFTSIAHESASESMDAAMTMRDKVIGVLQNSKTASR